MKNIAYVLGLLLLGAGVYLATAHTTLCRPEGMSDAEASRIIEIATAQGEHFRQEIDATRERGISLRSDTTYDDILTDTERTLDLAREFYFRQSVPNRIMISRVEQGEDLDAILMESGYPLKRPQVNYFALALDQNLKDLALAIGAEPVEGSYSYSIDPNIYVFALAQFTRSAGLKNTGGREWLNVEFHIVSYGFVETWPFFRADRLAKIRFSITGDLTKQILTINPIFHLSYSWEDDRLSDYFFVNRGCLATFTE